MALRMACSLLSWRGRIILAIDDDHVVLFRQCDGVLDGGITGTHNNDGLAFVGLGIVELVLDERKVFAGNAELAQIALQAYAENHGLGFHRCAVSAFEFEDAIVAALDGSHFGLVADIDLEAGCSFVPAAKDVSRRPAVNGIGERSGRMPGSSITYLPFW